MKALTITLAAATLALCSNTALAHSEVQYQAGDNSASTDICMAVAKDKPLLVNQHLKEYRIQKNRINKVIKCNGADLATFANQLQATRSIAFLHLDNNLNKSYTVKNVK